MGGGEQLESPSTKAGSSSILGSLSSAFSFQPSEEPDAGYVGHPGATGSFTEGSGGYGSQAPGAGECLCSF